MKNLMLLITLAATVVAAFAGPAAACAGGAFGGRRSTECCNKDADFTCDPLKTAWIQQASCDWWCCPSTHTYAINKCGAFGATGVCCSASATVGNNCTMVSPNPLTCTP